MKIRNKKGEMAVTDNVKETIKEKEFSAIMAVTPVSGKSSSVEKIYSP